MLRWEVSCGLDASQWDMCHKQLVDLAKPSFIWTTYAQKPIPHVSGRGHLVKFPFDAFETAYRCVFLKATICRSVCLNVCK